LNEDRPFDLDTGLIPVERHLALPGQVSVEGVGIQHGVTPKVAGVEAIAPPDATFTVPPCNDRIEYQVLFTFDSDTRRQGSIV